MQQLLVLAAVSLLPMYFSVWARQSRDLVGVSVINWVVMLAVGLAFVQWFGSRLLKRSRSRFPLPIAMVALFVVPYVFAHLSGYSMVDQIPPELVTSEGAFSSMKNWYLSHLGMSLLTTVGMAVAIASALQRGVRLTHVLTAMALPLVPVVAHALIVTFTSGLSLGDLTSEQNRHFLQNETTFGLHGNALGQYSVFAYVLFLGAIEGTPHSRTRSFFVVMAVVAIAGVLIGFSRAAFGVTTLVTLLWNVRTPGAKKWLVPALVLVLFLFMPADLFQRVGKGVATGDIDQILSGRLQHMWIPALQEVGKNPWTGHGWGAYMWSDAVLLRLAYRTATVHNAYIRLLMEMGIVGLALVLAFYAWIFAEAHRLVRFAHDDLTRAMLKAVRWLVVAMLLTGMIGDAITPEMIQVYFWYGIGIFLWYRATLVERARVPLNAASAA